MEGSGYMSEVYGLGWIRVVFVVGPGVCVEQAVCLQWSEAMARKKFFGSIHVTITQQVPCKPLVYASKR